MNWHRTILFGLAVIVAAGFLYAVWSPKRGNLDAVKVVAAIEQYRAEMLVHGRPLPPSIPLQELITRGYLQPEDVSAFAGMEVTVYLDGTNAPHKAVMRAQFPDGRQLVLLGDGSVQEVRAEPSPPRPTKP